MPEHVRTELTPAYYTGVHTHSFRPGRSAKIIGVGYHPDTGHLCYEVEYPDGVRDFCVLDDPGTYTVTPHP